jgi:hypothetical protein
MEGRSCLATNEFIAHNNNLEEQAKDTAVAHTLIGTFWDLRVQIMHNIHNSTK